MQFGAASPRQRPQLIDLNVIPPEFRRRPFPILTTGLSLVLVGSVLLLYGVFYLKTYGDWEVSRLRARVAQAQEVVRAATSGEAVANQERQRLLTMRGDYQVLVERQVRWSQVLAAIADAPRGISVNSIRQAGYTVTVHGTAPDYTVAAQYLEQLQATDLFLNMSIELAGEAGPPASSPAGSPTAVGTSGPLSPTPAGGAAPQPPEAQPSPAMVATATLQPTATATVTASPTPTRTATPTATRTATPTAIPTPTFDYAVESRAQKPHTTGPADVSYIRGRVVDPNGQLIPGIQLRISSEGAPPWSADGPPPDRRNGTFEFVVTRGRFSLYVLDGRSEVATGIYTGATGLPDTYDWEIVFKKVPPVPTPEGPPGSPTATPTATSTPYPTPTPISPGPDVASQASVSVSNNGDDARLAVDGDAGTAWNARGWPVQSIQLAFPSARQIEGLELVVSQTPGGSTTHELWIFDEAETWTLQTTFQSTTEDYDVLPYRFSPVKSASKLLIRTIRSPSFVAWREIRVYEPLPSPAGPSTPTPSKTPVPSPTATPTTTPTFTVTPTPTMTPTATATPTATSIAPGPNVASQATLVASANQADAGKAVDKDAGTYWSTTWSTETGPLPSLKLVFSSFHKVAGVELVVGLLNASPTPTPLAGAAYQEVELWLWDGFDWVLKTTFKQNVVDGQVLSYPLATPQDASAVFVRTLRGPNPVAWREIRVYEVMPAPTPFPTLTPTPTPTNTPTPTLTPTPAATAPPTATPIAPGANVAPSATAITTANPNDARLAIDGNTSTYWNAGTPAPQDLRLAFPTPRAVEGVELVIALLNWEGTPVAEPAMQSVQLWFSAGSTPTPVTYFNGTYTDGQVLAYLLPTPQTVTDIWVRKLYGPGPVAWREIRVYEALPPPGFSAEGPTEGPSLALRPPAGYGLGLGLSSPAGSAAWPGSIVLVSARRQASNQGPVAFVLLFDVTSGGGYR